MSVIIHGMKMPKTCGDCLFCRPKGPYPTYCYAQGTPIKPSETDLRDGMCPLEERKSGKWIDHYGDTLCSECKTVFKELEYILDDSYPKYCPNCGAKMDGGENE